MGCLDQNWSTADVSMISTGGCVSQSALKHRPSFRNHAFSSISHLTGPDSVGANQVCEQLTKRVAIRRPEKL